MENMIVYYFRPKTFGAKRFSSGNQDPESATPQKMDGRCSKYRRESLDVVEVYGKGFFLLRSVDMK